MISYVCRVPPKLPIKEEALAPTSAIQPQLMLRGQPRHDPEIVTTATCYEGTSIAARATEMSESAAIICRTSWVAPENLSPRDEPLSAEDARHV